MSEEILTSVGALLVRLRGAGADVKWVRPEAVHLTLKFLDEIDSSQVERVKQAMMEAAAGHRPFDLRVSDIGGFPSLRSPRVIWAGISVGAELGLLQADLEDRLVREGFKRENRPFAPHLTLGRIRSGRDMDRALDILRESAGQVFGKAEIREIVLMESRLLPKGAEYSSLFAVALQTAAST